MSEEDTIRQTIAAWLRASKDGDHDTLGRILDDDMLFVVPARPPFGKAEFLAGAAGKPHHFHADIEIAEVIVNGDWAFSRVALTIAFAASPGSDVLQMSGPAMTVWRRKSDGRWVIWRDANMVAPREALS